MSSNAETVRALFDIVDPELKKAVANGTIEKEFRRQRNNIVGFIIYVSNQIDQVLRTKLCTSSGVTGMIPRCRRRRRNPGSFGTSPGIIAR